MEWVKIWILCCIIGFKKKRFCNKKFLYILFHNFPFCTQRPQQVQTEHFWALLEMCPVWVTLPHVRWHAPGLQCCCCCKVASVESDSARPHRWQPTRVPRPWDSSGKNTGVGCHFLLQCMKVRSESEVTQSCRTLSDLMDCSLPGSYVHGIYQARVLEWLAIAFSAYDQ